eukprot:6440252-Pyramimonas_sp.AAC.1
MARRSRDDLRRLGLSLLLYNRAGAVLRLRRSFWSGLLVPFKLLGPSWRRSVKGRGSSMCVPPSGATILLVSKLALPVADKGASDTSRNRRTKTSRRGGGALLSRQGRGGVVGHLRPPVAQKAGGIMGW